MNTKPDKTPSENQRPNPLSMLAYTCLVLVLAGTYMTPGCGISDPNQTPKPTATVSEKAKTPEMAESQEAAPREPETTQDEQDLPAEKPETGILEQASKLLQSAKSKSSGTAAGAIKLVQEKLGGAAEAGGQTAEETWNWANDTFETLKAQGLTTANNTSEWLGQEWSNMESWEYKIVTLSGSEEELEGQLNELGKVGWECFNTESQDGGLRFFFKKPKFSYLRQLPFKDVIKLVPMMNNGNQ